MRLRTGKPEDVGVSVNRINKVLEKAQGWVDEGIHPSLVILAARRGVIFLHEALGSLGTEDPSCPIELNTIFPLASISKLFTATAAMILVEEGLLGLNRPVQDFIPEFEGEGKEQVMVHHLLTHSAGIDDEATWAIIDEKEESAVAVPSCEETQHPTVHRYLYYGYDFPLSKKPGVEMSYCNYGYYLLGEVIRRVSGLSLDRFATERIFKPLGMKNTWFSVPEDARYRVVQRPSDAPFAELGSVEYQEVPSPAGGGYSTAMDVTIFGQMFLNGGFYDEVRILSPASVHAMTRNQIPGIGAHFRDEYFPEADWGLGWSIHQNGKSWAYGEILQSQRSFCHGGAGGVFLWVDPVYEVVAVFFSVVLELLENERPKACTDLFINAVLSSIVEL